MLYPIELQVHADFLVIPSPIGKGCPRRLTLYAPTDLLQNDTYGERFIGHLSSKTELILEILHFPHPILRHPAKPIRRVDENLRAAIRRMFELMYEHSGVGLAAPQVGIPLRFFVANETGSPHEGTQRVFINPVISQAKGVEEEEEGCLSIPSIRGRVKRNKTLFIRAFDLQGNEIAEPVGGFMARIIQHETDHLDGILFLDRLTENSRLALEERLSDFVADFEARQKTGSLPNDPQIAESIREWESRYC